MIGGSKRLAAALAAGWLMAAGPAMPPEMMEGFLQFDAWAVGGELSAAERQELTALFEAEWRRDPAGMTAKAAQIARLRPRLHMQQLTLEDGVLRERLWDGSAKVDDAANSREVAILAGNPAAIGTDGNRIATRASVLAFVAAQDLIRALAGLPKVTDAEARADVEEARQIWAGLPPAGRERLFAATTHLRQLRAMLADPTMRAGVERDVKAHVRGPDDVGAMTVAQEDVAARFEARTGQLLRQAQRQAAESMYIGLAQNFYLNLK